MMLRALTHWIKHVWNSWLPSRRDGFQFYDHNHTAYRHVSSTWPTRELTLKFLDLCCFHCRAVKENFSNAASTVSVVFSAFCFLQSRVWKKQNATTLRTYSSSKHTQLPVVAGCSYTSAHVPH